MLYYNEIKDRPRMMRAFTGLDKAEFEELLQAFRQAWQADEKKRAKGKKIGSGKVAEAENQQ